MKRPQRCAKRVERLCQTLLTQEPLGLISRVIRLHWQIAKSVPSSISFMHLTLRRKVPLKKKFNSYLGKEHTGRPILLAFHAVGCKPILNCALSLTFTIVLLAQADHARSRAGSLTPRAALVESAQ